MTRYLLTININSSEYLKYDFARLKFNNQNTNLYRFESSNRDCLLNLLCDILDCFNETLDTSDQLIKLYIKNFKDDIPAIKEYIFSEVISENFEYEMNFGYASIGFQLTKIDNKKLEYTIDIDQIIEVIE